jgi:hypothetical protein
MATTTPIDEFAALRVSPPFRRMTLQQQSWLVEYLRTGSFHSATKLAYPEANDNSQRVMPYQILKAQAVRECLDWYRFRDAESSRQALIDIVRKQLEAAEPGSVSAQRLCAQLQSLTVSSKPSAPEPTPGPEEPAQAQGSKIGDIVLVEGVKYRVIAVDENGKPTDGEPIE